MPPRTPADHRNDGVDEDATDRTPSAPLPAYRELVLTMFGLFGREGHEWIPISTLIRLLEDAGADPSGIRATISRMTKAGILVNQRRGRSSSYRLNPELRETFSSGDRRIFTPVQATTTDPWLLVTFSLSEAQRGLRHQLRRGLSRLGFGTVSPGLWIAPGHLESETRDYLRRHDLMQYTVVFRAELTDQLPSAHWWNLDLLEARYTEFLDRYSDLPARLDHSAPGPHQIFRTYVVLLTHWRELPYLDPGLPEEILPPTWPGTQARHLFATIDARLRNCAVTYGERVMDGPAQER